MTKKLLLLALMLVMCCPFGYAADDIVTTEDKTERTLPIPAVDNKATDIENKGAVKEVGNEINKEEFPLSESVAPIVKAEDTMVVQGSVEKNIDITLNECIRFALGNNPRIREAMEDILASDARIKQAWSSYFPQLNFESSYSRIRQLQTSEILRRNVEYNYYLLGQVSLSQMLYDFGVTQNKVTIQKLEKDAYNIALTSTINDVIKNVKVAYFELLYAYDRKAVAEDTVNKFEMFYNQAKAYYEIGTNPKVDVTIAEVNLSNAKLELIQANNSVDIAMAKLNNAIGLPYMTQYNVKERLQYYPAAVSLDEAMTIAKTSRPDLVILDKRIEAARQNLKLSKKAYFPVLAVQGQYSVGGNNPVSDYGYTVGGFLRFPTVNGMLINNKITEAKALYQREISRAETSRNSIHFEIQQSYYTLDEKKNQLPVAFLGVKKAKENYELSYGRYRVGVGNPTELKDAQVAYQNAQLAYYKALFQYNSARAELEKAIGKNLVDKTDVIDLEK